jgi:mono/diheme cytochrome c family protein
MGKGVKHMKNVCVIVIAVLLVSIPLFLHAQGKPDGAQLFKARCGTCHEKNGEGLASAKIPPINKTAMTVEKLTAFITEGGGGKKVHYTPIVNISVDEARAIAEYVKKLAKGLSPLEIPAH